MITSIERATAIQTLSALPGLDVLRHLDGIPVLHVRVRSLDALAQLRRSPIVVFVEPRLLKVVSFSSYGCGSDPYPVGHWDNVAPGDAYPRNYALMRIAQAWNYAQGGEGVVVGLTDTGVDRLNPEFTDAGFASGWSFGRTIGRTTVAGTEGQTNPTCDHGTRMAGVIVAPRNGVSVVGVAWKASLYSVYTGNSVVTWNETDMYQAINDAGGAGSKLIVMAWGTGSGSMTIRWEIERLHYDRDVVFVGAAGTTFCGNNNSCRSRAARRGR